MAKNPPDLVGSLRTDTERPLKDRMKHVEEVTRRTQDLDTILQDVKTMEEICSALKCKVKVRDFAINCSYCKMRFCTAHYLPEVHGCGEAVRKDYKQKYLHPGPEKVPQHKKEQNVNKLQQKIKQMENSRKKVNSANSSKASSSKRK